MTKSLINSIKLLICVPQSKGKYEVMAGTLKSPDELVEMFVGLISKYPAIVALVDAFRKEVRKQLHFHSLNHLYTLTDCTWFLKCFVARILPDTL